MRIAIFGAGGVGGYFGGRLAQAGVPVSFIARGEHLAAMRRTGLRVESVAGDFVLEHPDVTDDPAEVGTVDFVLMAVKTWQLPTASQLAPLIGDHTAVVSLLNGVEAPDQLAEMLGREHALPGVVRVISQVAGPGRIQHTGGAATIAFAEWDNQPSHRVEALREALRVPGITVEVPADIQEELWAKFVFVVAMGGVGSVTRAPIGITRSRPETRLLLETAVREIEAVGLGNGIRCRDRIADHTMAYIDRLPADGTTSLQRDIVAGRRTELDAWTGAVVRLGARAMVGVPLHQFVYRALLPQELRARGEVQF
jgi:2-dehydropantoate 2-reductase